MELPKIQPGTLEYTKQKVEKEISGEMPISYRELREECETDPVILKLFEQMFSYAQSYVQDVWNMRELVKNKSDYSDDEWADIFAKADSDRTRLHDTYIESIAILVRNMGHRDMDNEWIRELMPAGKLERAACGKFAIMLVYSKYVNSN